MNSALVEGRASPEGASKLGRSDLFSISALAYLTITGTRFLGLPTSKTKLRVSYSFPPDLEVICYLFRLFL
jgi:hypothetical protein